MTAYGKCQPSVSLLDKKSEAAARKDEYRMMLKEKSEDFDILRFKYLIYSLLRDKFLLFHLSIQKGGVYHFRGSAPFSFFSLCFAALCILALV